MRIHVRYRGKKTTISLDDVLVDYLGAWCCSGQPEFHLDSKVQMKMVLEVVRKIVKGAESEDSSAPLSGRVQSMIIRIIAQEGLGDIVKARGPLKMPKKKPFRVPPEWFQEPKTQALIKASEPRQAS